MRTGTVSLSLTRSGQPYLDLGFRGDAGPEHQGLVTDLRGDGLGRSMDELDQFDSEGRTIGGPNFVPEEPDADYGDEP